MKHLGLSALKGRGAGRQAARRGQTNFVRMLWRFNSVFNPQRQFAEHSKESESYWGCGPPSMHTDVASVGGEAVHSYAEAVASSGAGPGRRAAGEVGG